MIADGHTVILQRVHHLGCHFALVVGVKQRALKLIAAIDQQGIRIALARFGNGGSQPCVATKTFAFGIVF